MQSTVGSRAVPSPKQQKKFKKQAETLLAEFTAYREGKHEDVQSLCWRVLRDEPNYFDAMRAELPARIAGSPAGNVAIYTQKVEAAYRQFWRDYCATASKAGSEQATINSGSH